MQRIALTNLLAVGSGGASGALARWFLDSLFQTDFASIIFINTLGSLAIGIAASLTLGTNWIYFIQTGALGSFTSMSAVIVLVQPSITTGQSLTAIAMTFIAAPLAVGIGKKIVEVGTR